MAEQTVDLRSTLSTLRRHLLVLTAATLVGAGVGATVAVANPPQFTSTSLVLLPQVEDAEGKSLRNDIGTEVEVAESGVVLGPAGESLRPTMTAAQLAKAVEVEAETQDVLKITAEGLTPAVAAQRSQAVAEATTDYSDDAQSSLSTAQSTALQQRRRTLKASLRTVTREIRATQARREDLRPGSSRDQAEANALAQLVGEQGDLVLKIDRLADQQQLVGGFATAQVIQDASAARRTGTLLHLAVLTLVGALAGLVLAVVALALLARRERFLRYRNQMADALGSPVVASVRSQGSRTISGWTSLLQSYQPGTVDAWALRQVLREVSAQLGTRERPARGGSGRHREGTTVLVVALADDRKGMAVGPQLASYAASLGVRTRLYAAQRHSSAAALWAACHRGHGQEEVRPGLFVDTGTPTVADPELTVVIAVLDRRSPEMSISPDADRSFVAVSSGAVTAEDIARCAVAADDAGCAVAGLVVADPDPLDRTTGRMPQHERLPEVALPARVTGLPTPGPSGTAGRTS